MSPISILVATAQLAVGDPVRTRTVYAAMLFLIAIGAGLIALTIWLVRATRHEPEYLAPLELMASRRWRRSDPVAQRRMLDEVRPEGAEPLAPSAPPPSGDDEFDLGPTLRGFEDLSPDATTALGADGDAFADAETDVDTPTVDRGACEDEADQGSTRFN